MAGTLCDLVFTQVRTRYATLHFADYAAIYNCFMDSPERFLAVTALLTQTAVLPICTFFITDFWHSQSQQ